MLKREWPRRYHLHIAQTREMANFGAEIIKVLEKEPKCIVIESQPRPAGIAGTGNLKWRECFVSIKDVTCMIAMRQRFQEQSILLRPKSV